MRLFLLFSFSALVLHEAYGFTDEPDRKALLDIKSQVSEENQDVLSSWNNSSPLCNWKGVTCGLKHKRVTRLDLGGCQLRGTISPSIGNLSFLISLNLSDNSIGGTIPYEVGNLFRLNYLNMSFNILGGEIPVNLFNCSRLLDLDLWHNHLEGGVPSEGKIPDDLARLTQLVHLELGVNKFSGGFPLFFYNFSSLEYLSMFGNVFSGSLKPDFGNLLPKLRLLYMGTNSFTGPIPTTLSNISNLQKFGIEYNKMIGSIPSSLGKLKNLQRLLLNNNSLGSCSSGDLDFLKALSNCTQLHTLLVNRNRFGGDLPTSITNLSTNLWKLDLGTNFISGTIPYGIGNLVSLQKLVLRENLLTGPLPSSIGKLSRLVFLNLTSNRMSGEIPSSIGNITGLEKLNFLTIVLKEPSSESCSVQKHIIFVVFKALLPTENKVVAVKVINLQRRGAMKSFLTECESLKDIWHRNLVKLLTACSSTDLQGNDFRALIYELMPNGSLDMWLHPEEVEEIHRPSRPLTLFERLNISPSNVLLDKDLTGHVSEFGIARLLMQLDQESLFNQLSSAGVRGTIGYAAPEYGMGGQPSIYGDVYSFGVLLLEMFTEKRPTNDLFGGNVTLNCYIKLALPERVLDIADNSIFNSGLRACFPLDECLIMVFKVGLRCCEESPKNRLATSEARKELILIIERFFIGRR
ncbi:hypothetical protein F2Q70_00022951 [Brassica cretica]|uniref:Protein kinase domain-containing protein n=1 Tax=Brassica cretica TaxID=69181 RepID=A0A8S9GG78_BRACR|nr:hypothetical protein F2Q70_00022951 [Brassica cretica]